MSKLYTEEQVRIIANQVRINGYWNDKDFIPIQLPTDEEIEEISKHEILYNNSKKSWWLEGAKWMRDKIKGGQE